MLQWVSVANALTIRTTGVPCLTMHGHARAHFKGRKEKQEGRRHRGRRERRRKKERGKRKGAEE